MHQISVEVELDASDDLEAGRAAAVLYGIHPQLAALELLVYPPSSTVDTSASLSSWGSIEVAPTVTPLTLFIWGSQRVIPVRVESFRISEQLFDPSLNPIQATVSLELRVLSYADFEPSSAGHRLFMAYQRAMEALAARATTTGFAGILTSDPTR